MRRETVRVKLEKAGRRRFEVTRARLTTEVGKAEEAARRHGKDLAGKMTHMPSNSNLTFLEGAVGMTIIEEHGKKRSH